MKKVVLQNTILGTRPLSKGSIVPTRSSGTVKSLTGEFEWQDDGVEVLTNPLASVNSPTGSGKQVIVSTAAFVHYTRYKRRALITVPSINLGTDYIHTNVIRRSGEVCKYNISPALDFRSTEYGYHPARNGTIQGLREFLLGGAPAIAVATHQSLVGAWQTLSLPERKQAFSNLWLGCDEAHHLSGVLSYDEELEQGDRKRIMDARTHLGDIAEYLCNEYRSLNSGFSPISATFFRGDKVPLFYDKVESALKENSYVRSFIEHWKFLRFKEFRQECIGFDDPIETLLPALSPDECSLVYLPPCNCSFRRNNPEYLPRMLKAAGEKGRVLDLITTETQEENLQLLYEDNQRYKAGAARKFDFIFAVNMMREGSDYLPLAHVYDFFPSTSLGRTVQGIGRMTRRDISPEGVVRKDTIGYTSFYSNLHNHNTEEEVRTLVSDRINQGLAGMLGVYSLFDDTQLPSGGDGGEIPATQIHRRMEEVFGEHASKAREIFVLNLASTNVSVDDAAFATVRELRQKVEGRPSWGGSLEDAVPVLKAMASFVAKQQKPHKAVHENFKNVRPSADIPSSLEERGILAGEIREAGFDITTIRRAFVTMFGAEADIHKFQLLHTTLNSLVGTRNKMQFLDKAAATFAFSPHTKDKSKKAKKAFDRRRRKFKKKGVATALSPNVGEP